MARDYYQIDAGVLNAIKLLLPRGSTLLELGSGAGTTQLTKRYTVYSVENDEEWLGICTDANYIHAPIRDLQDSSGRELKWYDIDVLAKELPSRYDLVLVDGPAGHIGREGLLTHLDLFRTDIPFVFDDTLRDRDCSIARQAAFLLNRPMYVFWNFSVVPVNPLEPDMVRRLQSKALEVLHREESTYLENYFLEITPVTEIDPSLWIEGDEEKELEEIESPTLARSEVKPTKAEVRLDLIESSFAYRIGRLLMLPFWPIHQIRVWRRNRG